MHRHLDISAGLLLACVSLTALPPATAQAQEAESAIVGTYVLAELGALLIEANAIEGRNESAWLPVLFGIVQLGAGSALLALMEDPLGNPWAAFGTTLLVQGGWHAIGFPLVLHFGGDTAERRTQFSQRTRTEGRRRGGEQRGRGGI